MTRYLSKMTAPDLIAWKNRHRLTVLQASYLLGISRAQFRRAIKSNRVTLQTARIIELMNERDERRVGLVTARDLLDIAAHIK